MNLLICLTGMRACCAGVLMFCLFGLTGCDSTRVAVSDVDSGKQLLESTFNDWKKGATVEEMKQKSPAVYVAEELWEQGFILNEFTVQSEGELYGTNVRLQVTLQLTDKVGKKTDRTITYLVTTTPALTITRDDRQL